jgi:phosphonate degradation associated HDIG domain protein
VSRDSAGLATKAAIGSALSGARAPGIGCAETAQARRKVSHPGQRSGTKRAIESSQERIFFLSYELGPRAGNSRWKFLALTLRDIERLFQDHGHIEYSGEAVTQLEHALQSAELAERDNAPIELVTAAFLHDLGHLLNRQGETPTARGIDDQHQYFAIPFIRPLFRPAVVEAIRLHVDAKRALCALEPEYYERLSEDSKRSLTLQGGIFSEAESRAFVAKPFAENAMRVRRWDDAAKVPGKRTPPIERYLEIASRCTAG